MARNTTTEEHTMSAIPSAERNTKFRNETATRWVAQATGKRHALATEWLNLSADLDGKGQHILADKAIVNALMIAVGSVPMSRLPITVGQEWA
jgi:hypothetical protein